jgi:AcrR family transcriptional regulator
MFPMSTLIYDGPVAHPSTSPRSTYHHGNLRAALVEAATELARTSGPDGVALREVARRTGVSHNAAYRHFTDRDQLIGEVAAVAMQRLEDAMHGQLRRVRTKDPAEAARLRLRAVGRGYVEFALAEPGLFETAFSSAYSGPEGVTDPYRTRTGGAYGLLGQVLDENLAAGNVAPGRRPGAEVVCWAAMHGFASLHLRGPLRVVPAKQRDQALELVLDRLEQGLA